MRCFFLLPILMISVNSFSQNYKKLNLGLGLGYVYGGDYKSGILIYAEPAYRLNNRISFGLRLEGLIGDLHRSATGSYTLNSQYYFLNGPFRPFVGVGAGVYYLWKGGEMCDCGKLVEPVAGFYPRAGFAYGHLIFNVEYNFQATAKMTIWSDLPGSDGAHVTDYVRGNYMSTKLGFIIGGGRKRKSTS